MDIGALQQYYGVLPKAQAAGEMAPSRAGRAGEGKNDFGSVFDAALNVLDETNSLQVRAQNEEVKFALGEADNTHDLAIAQQKANVALQYTVAIRDRFIQAYQEIMQMQI